MRISKIALLLAVLAEVGFLELEAFVPSPRFGDVVTAKRRRQPTPGSEVVFTPRCPSSQLFYIDENNKNENKPASSSSSSQKKVQQFTIPVLGPLPGNPPLLVGAELFLNVPTPLQWQALEEAFHIHQAHLKDSGVTGIDSAPLVAIMDEYTGSSTHNREGRYATIAAVLGVTANQQRLDLTDASTFMESLSTMQRSATPQEGKIRLLGIGRANLHDFFYQVPTSSLDANEGGDDEGLLLLNEGYDDDDDYYDDDDEDDDEYDEECRADCEDRMMNHNIVMAKFRLLVDGIEHSPKFLQQRECSRFTSPVHAVSEMSSLAMKLNYLHSDRIKLVNGIKAAQIRYRRSKEAALLTAKATTVPSSSSSSSMTSLLPLEDDEDDLIDHDGLGMLFAQKEWEATQPAMDQFLAEFAASASPSPIMTETITPDGTSSSSSVTTSTNSTTAATVAAATEIDLKLTAKNNYGMGTSASSISNLVELTQAYVDRLAPYYSPARRATEEYFYEIWSFAALSALSDFVEPRDLGMALQSRNTNERLQQAYDWMWNHILLLKEDAQVLSRLLLDCGEECTDLF